MDKKDMIANKSLIIRELFYFFTILTLIFVLMEIIWPNIIIAYFNLNYLVIVWVVFGSLTLIKK